MPSIQIFAFNANITAELKSRVGQELLDSPREYLYSTNGRQTLPSVYQRCIFDWFATGTGSVVVKAVAGSGKTTTIINGLRYIPDVRLKDISVNTFHSIGFRAILKRLGIRHDQAKIDSNKVRQIARDTLDDLTYDLYADFVVKLIGLAKGAGLGALVPDGSDAWYSLVQHHDLYLDTIEASEERAMEIARTLLKASNDASATGWIDFNDQLYLPLLWRCKLWQNDFVIIDEAQDVSPVRLALAKLALRPGGRLVAVGDDCQAIYGFTGASNDALDIIRQAFRCAELPLTVSYRCPKVIAERVRAHVPYFEVPETAIQGEVRQVTIEEAVRLLGPEDAVACRQTAPLVKLAFSLIARKILCNVLGKEIGKGLVSLIKKQKARGVDHLLEKLTVYRDREVTKLMARGEESKAEGINDRVACIFTVIESLKERTQPALIIAIECLFDDHTRCLTLATCHKLKGKEYRRVGILRPDLMPSKWARQEHQYRQELNLMYVTDTRAMEMLLELVGETLPSTAPRLLTVEVVS